MEKEKFKEPSEKLVPALATEPQASTLQSKLFEYKNIIVNKIYEGMDVVENTLKKMKGEVPTPVRLLERLFFKQIEMANKHQKGRQKLENVIGENAIKIQPSVYEKGATDMKVHVLMSLRWLLGF